MTAIMALRPCKGQLCEFGVANLIGSVFIPSHQAFIHQGSRYLSRIAMLCFDPAKIVRLPPRLTPHELRQAEAMVSETRRQTKAIMGTRCPHEPG